MKLLFWNIRAGGGRRIEGILSQIQHWNPDVIALAEFRGTSHSQQLSVWLADSGWPFQVHTTDPAKPATNALCLAAGVPVTPISHPTAPSEPNRWLFVSLPIVQSPHRFAVGVMHVPNYVTGRKYPYHNAVLRTIDTWSYGPGLLIGDTNTGKQGLDEEVPCFNQREHQWMEAIEDRGWCDAFRHLHGEKRVYTWYSPNGKNGFRLDEAFVNPELTPFLIAARYVWGQNHDDPDRRDGLSDHAALLIELEILITDSSTRN